MSSLSDEELLEAEVNAIITTVNFELLRLAVIGSIRHVIWVAVLLSVLPFVVGNIPQNLAVQYVTSLLFLYLLANPPGTFSVFNEAANERVSRPVSEELVMKNLRAAILRAEMKKQYLSNQPKELS